jgi:hypothetical protein
MEVSKSEQMVTALEATIGRELTDDEKSGIAVWSKSFDLAHFIEGFPQEWQVFKEMLISYLGDLKSQWDRLEDTDPANVGNLEVMHAQVYGANKVIGSFIRDVENAPNLMREVPEVVTQNAGQLRSMPS